MKMRKNLLLSILAVFLFANSYGQNRLWNPTNVQKLAAMPKTDRTSFPQEFKVFALDLPAMKTQLQLAPSRLAGQVSNVIVQFPTPDGTMESFRIYNSPVMEEGLASRYPEIQTYIGTGIENPTTTINLSTTVFGLHVMLLTEKGTFYIDPFTKDLHNYIVYAKRDLVNTLSWQCHFEDTADTAQLRNDNPQTALASDGQYRQYRLAMACTIEYAAFHITAAGLSNLAPLAQKKAAVLAAMVVTMARVNGVYEKDMSLHMNLIANNDAIIFVTSDNFSNDSAGALINESQLVIDATIGTANYDIGHTVSTGGGGLAQLNSPCSGNKARGITGSPAPVGDPYDIDYVAHEMGHQFGGGHTFSGTTGSCSGNISQAQAVEPGSGSTIMAYAGICSPQDVQTNSDAYFHAISIAQMSAFVAAGGNCSANTANGNQAPVVNAGLDYTIPFGTAFVLKGSATDGNNDALTYCWEQTTNTSGAQPPVATSISGPNFRSYTPTSSPNRYFPRFSDILGGNLTPTWEVVPNVARTMGFALTARDNRAPNGGQTGRDNMIVTFAGVGPFAITSPNTENVSWATGSTQTVTWNVAGTTANNINTANVNILLSTDGGATFNTVLAANTPNDGSQSVTLPATAAPYCRIMVEAVGNIYFAVSKSIALGYTIANTCNTYTNSVGFAVPDGTGNNISGPAVTSTINVPANNVITDVNVVLVGTHTYYWDFIARVIHPDGTAVRTLNRNCNQVSTGFNVTFNDGSPAIACAAALTGTFAPADPLSVFNGKPSNGNWTLSMTDNYLGDTGSISSWSIIVCAQTAQLATQSFELADFAVYPNPNNGNFNIKFNGTSSNGVKVLVHDMRGRKVFESNFANSATFNENISLQNAQTGMYILTVTDGERKMVKKIAVE